MLTWSTDMSRLRRGEDGSYLAPRKWCKDRDPHAGHHFEWRNGLIYYCKGSWRNKH